MCLGWVILVDLVYYTFLKLFYYKKAYLPFESHVLREKFAKFMTQFVGIFQHLDPLATR